MAQPEQGKKLSRIQLRNRHLIMDAALNVFSQNGFRGATLDQIAEASGLSKPNILYYFSGKEEIYVTLLNDTMASWSDPLRALDPAGDPVQEILAYVARKMEMSRQFPRESRLFANEVIQGGDRAMPHIQTVAKDVLETAAGIIQIWVDKGAIAPVDPKHLITSIWATTQHYADFDAQIRVLIGNGESVMEDGQAHLMQIFERALRPS